MCGRIVHIIDTAVNDKSQKLKINAFEITIIGL